MFDELIGSIYRDHAIRTLLNSRGKFTKSAWGIEVATDMKWMMSSMTIFILFESENQQKHYNDVSYTL